MDDLFDDEECGEPPAPKEESRAEKMALIKAAKDAKKRVDRQGTTRFNPKVPHNRRTAVETTLFTPPAGKKTNNRPVFNYLIPRHA